MFNEEELFIEWPIGYFESGDQFSRRHFRIYKVKEFEE